MPFHGYGSSDNECLLVSCFIAGPHCHGPAEHDHECALGSCPIEGAHCHFPSAPPSPIISSTEPVENQILRSYPPAGGVVTPSRGPRRTHRRNQSSIPSLMTSSTVESSPGSATFDTSPRDSQSIFSPTTTAAGSRRHSAIDEQPKEDARETVYPNDMFRGPDYQPSLVAGSGIDLTRHFAPTGHGTFSFGGNRQKNVPPTFSPEKQSSVPAFDSGSLPPVPPEAGPQGHSWSRHWITLPDPPAIPPSDYPASMPGMPNTIPAGRATSILGSDVATLRAEVPPSRSIVQGPSAGGNLTLQEALFPAQDLQFGIDTIAASGAQVVTDTIVPLPSPLDVAGSISVQAIVGAGDEERAARVRDVANAERIIVDLAGEQALLSVEHNAQLALDLAQTLSQAEDMVTDDDTFGLNLTGLIPSGYGSHRPLLQGYSQYMHGLGNGESSSAYSPHPNHASSLAVNGVMNQANDYFVNFDGITDHGMNEIPNNTTRVSNSVGEAEARQPSFVPNVIAQGVGCSSGSEILGTREEVDAFEAFRLNSPLNANSLHSGSALFLRRQSASSASSGGPNPMSELRENGIDIDITEGIRDVPRQPHFVSHNDPAQNSDVQQYNQRRHAQLSNEILQRALGPVPMTESFQVSDEES